MIDSTVNIEQSESKDRAIWLSLRKAIAKSSGFQRWQQEQNKGQEDDIDLTVRRYLEETLETLAY